MNVKDSVCAASVTLAALFANPAWSYSGFNLDSNGYYLLSATGNSFTYSLFAEAYANDAPLFDGLREHETLVALPAFEVTPISGYQIDSITATIYGSYAFSRGFMPFRSGSEQFSYYDSSFASVELIVEDPISATSNNWSAYAYANRYHYYDDLSGASWGHEDSAYANYFVGGGYVHTCPESTTCYSGAQGDIVRSFTYSPGLNPTAITLYASYQEQGSAGAHIFVSSIEYQVNVSNVSLVPEPSQSLMLLTGVGLVGFVTRRRIGKRAG